jgi:hypothetical protein
MKALLFLFTSILIAGSAVASPVKFSFNGKNTGNDVFASTGIVVVGHDSKEFIVLTNAIARYSIVLPYSEEWAFDFEKGHLTGTAGPMNFDVQIWTSGDTPEQHLTFLKDYLLANGKPIPPDSAEIIKSGSESLLRTEVNMGKIRPAFEKATQINFYSVKKWRDTLYKLHFSAVVHPELLPCVNERKLLFFLTDGYRVNVRP